MSNVAASAPVEYDLPFYEGQEAGSRRSAEIVLPLVFDMLRQRPRRVVDVGCGVGTWLAAAARMGVEHVHGIDGDYVPRERLQVRPEQFETRDLRASGVLEGSYDVAMSLEVAEHLPANRADTFVHELVSLAPVILFSAAAPHQPGTSHVNCQWPPYWIERFAREGYQVVDRVRPLVWEDPAVEWWYAQNTMVFVTSADLLRSDGGADWGGIAVVHPRNFEETCARPVTLREVARSSPALLKQLVTSTAWRARRLGRRIGLP